MEVLVEWEHFKFTLENSGYVVPESRVSEFLSNLFSERFCAGEFWNILHGKCHWKWELTKSWLNCITMKHNYDCEGVWLLISPYRLHSLISLSLSCLISKVGMIIPIFLETGWICKSEIILANCLVHYLPFESTQYIT